MSAVQTEKPIQEPHLSVIPNSPRPEVFHETGLLWAPLIGVLIFSILNIVWFTDSSPKSVSSQLYLMDYLFLNKVHTVIGIFVFFLIFETFQLHQFSRKTIVEFAVLYAGIFVFLMLGALNRGLYSSPFYLVFYLYLVKWAPLAHNVHQSRGLGLLFSFRSQSSESERETLAVLSHREKIASIILVIGAFLTADARFKFLFTNVPWPEYLFEVGVGIQIVALIGLAATSFQISKLIGNRKKLLYDCRYLLYPIASVSLVAYIAIRLVHTIEYFFTMKHVLKHSETPARSKRRIYFWLPVVAGLFAALFLGREIERHLTGSMSILGSTAFNLCLTINVLHFHYDSKMFRMKNPIIRKYVGKLLLKAQ